MVASPDFPILTLNSELPKMFCIKKKSVFGLIEISLTIFQHSITLSVGLPSGFKHQMKMQAPVCQRLSKKIYLI